MLSETDRAFAQAREERRKNPALYPTILSNINAIISDTPQRNLNFPTCEKHTMILPNGVCDVCLAEELSKRLRERERNMKEVSKNEPELTVEVLILLLKKESKMYKNAVIISMTMLLLVSCTTTEKETSSTLVGAAGGAVIGSAFGGGAGRYLGAAVGAAGGAYVGNMVGKKL